MPPVIYLGFWGVALGVVIVGTVAIVKELRLIRMALKR
jgi:hypothetical protein